MPVNWATVSWKPYSGKKKRGGAVGYLSQLSALAGVRVREQGGRFFQGFDAQLLGVRESHREPPFRSVPQYRGFVGASF